MSMPEPKIVIPIATSNKAATWIYNFLLKAVPIFKKNAMLTIYIINKYQIISSP